MHLRGKAFTLIEVLISIAIISVLTSLLVPTIDRSLSRNNLANDADLLRSKLEETRLLAGSTQQADQGTVGYYGLFLPGGNNDYFAILRLSVDGNNAFAAPCTPETGIVQAERNDSADMSCVVDRISLSKNVSLQNATSPNDDKLTIFRSPTQQVFSTFKGVPGRNSAWRITDPSFSNWGSNVQLRFKDKTATVTLEDYTAKMTVTFGGNQ